MTESASTPRLRATFAINLALLGAAAFVGPSDVSGAWYYASGIAGFLCVTLACLGRIWCSAFIAGHKDEMLVTAGPYARCRHPLYAWSIVGALGLGLTTRSLLLTAVVVVLIAALLIYAAAGEEQFLADEFPDEFKAYVAATPNQWWPSSARRPAPEKIEVRPAVFRKAFLDGASFFLLWVLVAVATEWRLAA